MRDRAWSGARRAALVMAFALSSAAAAAQDHSRMYPEAELAADATRLESRIQQIHTILKGYFRGSEKAALRKARIEFPTPQKDDYALEFYAYEDAGTHVVAMPVLSLKAVEDLTLAHAYLHYNKGRYGDLVDPAQAIDIYFAMTRRTDPSDFLRGEYPPILDALGIPKDAYKEKRVGDLAVRFRNEAYTFFLAHELGHVVLGHKSGYGELSTEAARKEEAAADAFAFELMARTSTPAVGPFFVFTAQAYSLAHRGQFGSDDEWFAFMRERNHHPLTPDRLRAMARYNAGALADSRPKERKTWEDIARLQMSVADALDDRELQTCMAEIGETGDPVQLKSPKGAAALLAEAKKCRE